MMNNIEIELKKVQDYLEKNKSTEISTSSIEDQLKLFYSVKGACFSKTLHSR